MGLFRYLFRIAWIPLAGAYAFCLAAPMQGPGIPQIQWQATDLWKRVPGSAFKVHTVTGQGRGMDHVAPHRGYLMVPFGQDHGVGGGGLTFYDFSDLHHPKQLSNVEEPLQREANQFGLDYSHKGADYVCFGSIEGLVFWDITDVRNPKVVARLALPGVSGNYDNGVWWLDWQVPYVYAAASGQGIYIVDASDPVHPVLKNHVSTNTLGGRINCLTVIGNLLVGNSSSDDGTPQRVATYDISDPLNPVLLDQLTAPGTGLGSAYAGYLSGGRYYYVGGEFAYAVDVSNPMNIQLAAATPNLGHSKLLYCTFQDEFLHVGGRRYYKLNASDLSLVHMANIYEDTNLTVPSGGNNEFATPIGNLIWVAADDAFEPMYSAFIPHQAEPDKRPPVVNMVSPPNGVTRQPLTSRIGLTLTDMINLVTLDSNSLIVRPLGGTRIPGRYSGQMGHVNFFPDQPLKANTTYEIFIPKGGGMTDYAGNLTDADFHSYFSTGATLDRVPTLIQPYQGRAGRDGEAGFGSLSRAFPDLRVFGEVPRDALGRVPKGTPELGAAPFHLQSSGAPKETPSP